MHVLRLKVITPKRIALSEESILSVTVPTVDGIITILPRHTNLFSLLKEGIVKIKKKNDEKYLAIGGGYLETNGEEVSILVSRAYGQDDIDSKLVEKAIKQAESILQKSSDKKERVEAERLLKRSLIDIKLFKKIRRIKAGSHMRSSS